MWGHIVAPALLTDGDWKRLLGFTALLQGCDGHLITWLTEVTHHLHLTGVSARPWPPLPPTACTNITKQIYACGYRSTFHATTLSSFFVFCFKASPYCVLTEFAWDSFYDKMHLRRHNYSLISPIKSLSITSVELLHSPRSVLSVWITHQ